MRGLLCARSEYSILNSTAKVEDLCRRAKELGYDAIALTDINSMSGIPKLIFYSMQYGLKPVIGITIKVDNNNLEVYIALIAKDDVGYQILCRLNTLISRDKVLTTKILQEEILQFGSGHLFAISCNEIGPADVAVHYEEIKKKEMKKLISEADDIVLDDKMIRKTNGKAEKVREELRILMIEKDELEKRALKNFSKKEEALLLLCGDEKEDALHQLELEKQDAEVAKAEVKRVAGKINRRKSKLTKLNLELEEARRKAEEQKKLRKEASQVKREIRNTGINDAMNMQVQPLLELFGSDFLIELVPFGDTDPSQIKHVIHYANDREITIVISCGVAMTDVSDYEVFGYRNLLSIVKDANLVKVNQSPIVDHDSFRRYAITYLIDHAGLDNGARYARIFIENTEKVFDQIQWLPFLSYVENTGVPDNQKSIREIERIARGKIDFLYGLSSWNYEMEKQLQSELMEIEEIGKGRELYDMVETIYRIFEERNVDADIAGIKVRNNIGSILLFLLGLSDVDPVQYALKARKIERPVLMTTEDADRILKQSILDTSAKVSFVAKEDRLLLTDAVREAGEIVSKIEYGVKDRFLRETETLLDMLSSSNINSDAFQLSDIESRIFDVAKKLEGTLLGIRKNDDVIAMGGTCAATLKQFPLLCDVQTEIAYSVLTGEDAELFGMGVHHYSISREYTQLSAVVEHIYKKRGERFKISAIPYEKEVLVELLHKGEVGGIPFIHAKEDAYILALRPSISFMDIVDVISKKRGCGSLDTFQDSFLSYQALWLKYHYPKEFLVEALNYADKQSLPLLLNECSNRGFEVACPDINRSTARYTENDERILYGRSSVKGVGAYAMQIVENRGNLYSGFADFLIRNDISKTAVKSLIMSGAFSAFCKSRSGLLLVYEQMYKRAERLRTLTARVNERREKLDNNAYATKKEIETAKKGIARDSEQIEILTQGLYSTPIPSDRIETEQERAKMESSVLPCNASRSELDLYDGCVKNITPMIKANPGTHVKVIGYISSIHTSITKKTNKDMASFTLTDKTGRMRAVCFPAKYKEYQDIIVDGAVVVAYGMYEKDETTDGCQLLISFLGKPSLTKKQVVVMADSITGWNPYQYIKADTGGSGRQMLVYYKDTGRIEFTDIRVNEQEFDGEHIAKVQRYIPAGTR